MVVKAVQNYVNLVNGLTKMTQDRALATARSLLAHAGLEDVANDATGRVTKLAEEIMLASRANRELMENLVAGEVDKAVGRFGYVRTDEVEALREEIAELRASLARATAESDRPAKKATARKAPRTAGAAGFATPTPATPTPAKKTAPRTPRKRVSQPPLGGAPAEPGSDPFSETLNEGPDISTPLPPGPVIPNPVEDRATSPAEPTSPAGEQEPIALGSEVAEAIEARTPVAELEVAEPHEAALELVTTSTELVPAEPAAAPSPPEASTTDRAAAKRAASRKSATPRKATTKKSAAAKTPAAGTSSTRKAPSRSTTKKKAPAKRTTKKSTPAGTPETEMPAVMNVDQDADQ